MKLDIIIDRTLSGSVETSGSPTNYFWSAHHADSGWGYIAFRNKMRQLKLGQY
jgi:hypothetical protein